MGHINRDTSVDDPCCCSNFRTGVCKKPFPQFKMYLLYRTVKLVWKQSPLPIDNFLGNPSSTRNQHIDYDLRIDMVKYTKRVVENNWKELVEMSGQSKIRQGQVYPIILKNVYIPLIYDNDFNI